MMKQVLYCKDCLHCKQELVPHPSGTYVRMFLCTHLQCSDPVDASPIPCGAARREVILCGMGGKYYEKKEPDKVTNETIKTNNIIQLDRK